MSLFSVEEFLRAAVEMGPIPFVIAIAVCLIVRARAGVYTGIFVGALSGVVSYVILVRLF